MSLLVDVLALKSAITARPFDGRAAFDAFLKVLADVIGPATVGAACGVACGEDEIAKAKACLEECVACCHTTGDSAEVVGKIGDGKILAALIKFLPIILGLL